MTERNPIGPPILSELDGMTYQELQAAKVINLANLRGIRASIQAAQATVISQGVYADPDWWRRVHSAEKICGLRDQAIAIKLGQLRRELAQKKEEEKRDRPPRKRVLIFPQVFMDVAQELLHPETFEAILQGARDRMSQAGGEVAHARPL